MINIKILVCSAWPYAYTVPHLGNLIGCLLSGDVFARYYRLKGFDTLYVSGTDMHGAKAEFEAKKMGIAPEDLLGKKHLVLKQLIKDFEINFDNYTTTESETHKQFVQEIYQQMDKNGYIKNAVEKRAFCENCSVFLADDFIEGTCPKCGFEKARGNQCDNCSELLEPEQLEKPHCTLCKKEKIIFKETRHWFIDLKKLQPEIEKYIAQHKDWTGNVKNFSENLLKQGLKPRAITRDLKWGIPAPFKGAEEKVIYVWAEAALGYVSATIEYFKDKKNKDLWKDFWTGNSVKQVYTIGKDNIPFHTIIFPGQLIASGQGYHLPDQIAATEYLNWEGGKKFSKSRSVGIFMDDALKLLPATHWRFYLLYDRPETRDTSFSWSEMEKTSNMILIGSFGNFVNRTLKFVERYYGLKVPKADLDNDDKILLDRIHVTEDVVSKIIESGKLKDALVEIMHLCNDANAYFQQREPWKNEEKRDSTTYVCIQLVKALAIFTAPFIPSVAEKIWSMLDLKEDISYAALEKEIPAGHEIKSPGIVVEKVDFVEVRENYEKLMSKTP